MEFSEIKKSSRHSKITGDLGEHLVLYWLSKHGFECARIDHTGIDLIACNPTNGERMGISVKSRSRSFGTEHDTVSIFKKDLPKVTGACKTFGCHPYFAIVVDGEENIQIFLVSIENFKTLASDGTSTFGWKMKAKDLEKYWQLVPEKLYAFVFHYKNYQ